MTERGPSDAELLQRYLEGDTEAFNQLMRSHEDRVFSICLRLLRDREAALDATQDTFITVFRKAGTFAGRSSFSTWLYRVAVNTCYDHLRRRRRHLAEPLSELREPADPSAGDGFLSAELRPELETALQALPIEFRAAVVLADVEGLGLQTVADALGIPIGTVKSRIFRGRRLLAKALGNRTDPSDTPTSQSHA